MEILLEEVAGLVAYIESTQDLPFAHLAPHYAALATLEIETALIKNEESNGTIINSLD